MNLKYEKYIDKIDTWISKYGEYHPDKDGHYYNDKGSIKDIPKDEIYKKITEDYDECEEYEEANKCPDADTDAIAYELEKREKKLKEKEEAMKKEQDKFREEVEKLKAEKAKMQQEKADIEKDKVEIAKLIRQIDEQVLETPEAKSNLELLS